MSHTVDENRPTPRHITVKFQNTGTQRRGKTMTYKATEFRMASACLTLILKARRQRTNVHEILQLELFTKPNYNLSVRVE